MASPGIVVDTCIVIDFLRSKDKHATKLWSLMESYSCVISSITLFEPAAGAKSDAHRSDIAKLRRWLEVVPFDDQCAQKAAGVYQVLKPRNELPEFRDLFIACSALAHSFPLATENLKHFWNIPGIELIQ